MPEENINQGVRLKKNRWNKKLINWRNKSNWIIELEHSKICRVLNLVYHSLIAISTITGCVSIATFASLVGVPIRITSYSIGLKICVKTTVIKKYKSIIKKKKKKYDKIVMLAKYK